MIRTIFFDLDNTLVNHTRAETDAIKHIKSKFFPKERFSVFHTVWVEKAQFYFQQYHLNKITFQEQRIKRMQDIWRNYSVILSPKEAETIFYIHYLSEYEKSWKTFQYVKPVLKKLKDQKIFLGIISNGNTNQQLKKLKQLKINRYFNPDLVFISEQIGFSKPDERVFRIAQKTSGNNPEEILFIGDSIENDITPALSMGWNVILADHFDKYSNSSHKRIKSFKELLIEIDA